MCFFISGVVHLISNLQCLALILVLAIARNFAQECTSEGSFLVLRYDIAMRKVSSIVISIYNHYLVSFNSGLEIVCVPSARNFTLLILWYAIQIAATHSYE